MISQCASNPETEKQPVADALLVKQSLAGDRSSFELLVKRYERAVRLTAQRIVRSPHLAQDAAQDAFVAAFSHLRGLRDPDNFAPWLLTIARQRALRLVRKHWWMPLKAADAIPAAPAEHVLDDVDALRHAIASLPEHERVVVHLRYFENHDIGQVAQILGRPVGTVTKQLSRAHERLRLCLQKEDNR